MHIYIFSGWGGRIPSAGMGALVPWLKPYGTVAFLPWNAADHVAAEAAKLPHTEKIALVGYSQGAVNPAWLDSRLPRPIDLSICYDPRGGDYGLSHGGFLYVVNHKRLVCFHNSPGTWFSPPFRYGGLGVETIPIDQWHPLVQANGSLHSYTIQSIKELAAAK